MQITLSEALELLINEASLNITRDSKSERKKKLAIEKVREAIKYIGERNG